MTDNQRQFLRDALTSILREEEDPNVEQLSDVRFSAANLNGAHLLKTDKIYIFRR